MSSLGESKQTSSAFAGTAWGRFRIIVASTLACSTPSLLFGQSGILDATFNPMMEGPMGGSPIVRSLANAPGARLLIGGSFTSANGNPRNYVAVLLANGSVDSSFPNLPTAIGPVRAVAVDTNGWYVLSGEFSGTPRRFLVRLSPSGVTDTGFVISPGLPNGSVDAIVVAPDNSMVIGGLFTLPRNHVARIAPSGIFDAAFNPGTVFVDVVRALALQPDGRILAGSSNLVLRLNADGSPDLTFNAGPGPEGGES